MLQISTSLTLEVKGTNWSIIYLKTSKILYIPENSEYQFSIHM